MRGSVALTEVSRQEAATHSGNDRPARAGDPAATRCLRGETLQRTVSRHDLRNVLDSSQENSVRKIVPGQESDGLSDACSSVGNYQQVLGSLQGSFGPVVSLHTRCTAVGEECSIP